jgi:hypothetical protein
MSGMWLKRFAVGASLRNTLSVWYTLCIQYFEFNISGFEFAVYPEGALQPGVHLVCHTLLLTVKTTE